MDLCIYIISPEEQRCKKIIVLPVYYNSHQHVRACVCVCVFVCVCVCVCVRVFVCQSHTGGQVQYCSNAFQILIDLYNEFPSMYLQKKDNNTSSKSQWEEQVLVRQKKQCFETKFQGVALARNQKHLLILALIS